MPERYQSALRIVCLALAAVVIVQVTRVAGTADPLKGLNLGGTESYSRSSNAVTTAETNLPQRIQGRIDRITQSEILGAVVRPLPMALLGIAGSDAFVRTLNGQTVLLREGEETGGVKLLRIGTNRVLIEHENEKKELTLFSGLGGATLLPGSSNATPDSSTQTTGAPEPPTLLPPDSNNPPAAGTRLTRPSRRTTLPNDK